LDPAVKADITKSAKIIALRTRTISFVCDGFLKLVITLQSPEVAHTLHETVIEVMSGKIMECLKSCTLDSLRAIAGEIIAANQVFQELLSGFEIAMPSFVAVARSTRVWRGTKK
jgi:hypothetical protein